VGFGFATVTPSATSVAQVGAAAVWTYPQRSLTDIQSLVAAIQSNDPSLLSSLSDILYVPAPFFAGQVSLTQVASFISTLVNNYNMAGVIAGLISGNPYTLWGPPLVASLIDVMGYTNVAQVLSLVSSSALGNIAINNNMSSTTLNQLITNAALSATAAQALLYGLAENYYYNKWIYAITANAPSSITFSANATLSTNVLIAQNITIASGVTVTCSAQTCFFIAQVFNNQGTIVNPNGGHGGSAPTYAGPGGTGGGGVAVLAVTAVMGTISVNGSPGVNGTVSAATESVAGGNGAGVFVVISGVAIPLGGNGGTTLGVAAGIGSYNGGGGGAGTALESGGAGGSATLYSFPNGNALLTYLIQGVSDWWLANVVGKAPPTQTPLLYFYGAGGGGGAGGTSGWGAGGGGGGGGGEVIIYGQGVTLGTVNAVGGNGGISAGNYSTGGGGGGGGIALVFYAPLVNGVPGGVNGTLVMNAAGGVGGSSSSVTYKGAAGNPGTAYIAAVTVNG
jgi:hypothetical protein